MKHLTLQGCAICLESIHHYKKKVISSISQCTMSSFFNLDESATAIYGENWAYAGIGYKTEKVGTWEVGPLYIFWVANKQNDLINFFYLQLSWITHHDFRKNKS